MSERPNLNLWNSILPLVGSCALVAWLLGWFAGRGNLSQAMLTRAPVNSALVTLVAGALQTVEQYAAINMGVWAQVTAASLERAGFFLGRPALFAVL
ncbi:MAG: hypothetical protein INF93_09940 [Rhodobacter sp.]|nr:hypothetical protein [Rhodobacter sp.]